MKLAWDDYMKHCHQQSPSQHDHSQEIHHLEAENWELPPAFYVKINVDAAFRQNKGVVTSVAQDSEGNFLCCITYCFTDTSTLKAEVRAYNLGVYLATSLNLEKVIVEGDAESVSTAINGTINQVPANIKMKIIRAKESYREFQNLVFKSVPRSANEIAHVLCQYANAENVTRSWYTHDPHHCILHFLMI